MDDVDVHDNDDSEDVEQLDPEPGDDLCHLANIPHTHIHYVTHIIICHITVLFLFKADNHT